MLRVENLSSSRNTILGVYSSPMNAWEIFHRRLLKGRSPYTGGIFHYSDKTTFQNALSLISPKTSIRIYYHEMFEVYVKWDVVDKEL